MNRIRKNLLQIFCIGIGIGFVIYFTCRNENYDVFGSLLIGLVLSPLAWGIYRLARFMFLPRRASF